MFVADTFGVSAPPFPVSASNNDPNMRTEELLLLPPPVRPRRGKSLREEDEEEDKETLPTVLEHAEATRMYYLLSVVVCFASVLIT
tara:strand:- start:233 stop:490 length:258 start_codon:yes stop_codon:yes gene_type:complete